MSKCLMCKSPIVPSKYCREKKYCSKKCRELYWKRLHPDVCKGYQKKYRLQTPVVCIFCEKEIPNEERRSGKVLCSEECRRKQAKLKDKKRRLKRSEAFRKYKEKLGCCLCGYNMNGACLDYHHEDGKEKERRVDAGLWQSNSEIFKREVRKCKLVCKNCHYELHNPR